VDVAAPITKQTSHNSVMHIRRNMRLILAQANVSSLSPTTQQLT